MDETPFVKVPSTLSTSRRGARKSRPDMSYLRENENSSQKMKKLKKAWKNDFIFPKRFTNKKSPPLPFLAEEDFFNFLCAIRQAMPSRGQNSLGQFSDLHHKGEIIPLRGGDIQISVIVRARIHGDYHRGKAHPHELEIHDEPGRSAVPVLEGVDVHEIRMDAGREFHRMQRTRAAPYHRKKASIFSSTRSAGGGCALHRR